MNKDESLNYPDKIDDPDEIDPEKYLLDILSKCTGKVDNGVITWSIGKQWIWKQDFKNGNLWCYFYRVWEVFDTEYRMREEQIQALHKKVVCKALNCEGLRVSPALWGYIGTPFNHYIKNKKNHDQRRKTLKMMCYGAIKFLKKNTTCR